MILLAGALRAELAPLMPRIRRQRRQGRHLVTGLLDGREVAVLRTGVGRKKAGQRTLDALDRLPVRAVISLGTCGGLVDTVAVGSVVTASLVGVEGRDATPARPLPGLPAVGLVTVDTVVWDPVRRRALAEAGYVVCEMEAAAVRDAARTLPFSALKVVSDNAGGDAPKKPDPLDVAAFQLLAAKLSAQGLVPALRQALASP